MPTDQLPTAMRTPHPGLKPGTPPGTIPITSNDASAWAAWLTSEDWPVLPESSDFLAMAAQTPGLDDAHTLAEQVDQDPLLVLKVLAFGAALQIQAGREPSAQTPLECVLLAGVEPFLRQFSRQAVQPEFSNTVADQDHIAQSPQQALRALLLRTRRAAAITRAVAIAKQDTQAARLYTAAQLYAAPELLLATRGIQPSTHGLDVNPETDPKLLQQLEQIAYGVTLDDMRQALLQHMKLPQTLLRLLHPSSETLPETRPLLVPLAHQLAALAPERLNTPAAELLVQKMALLLAQPASETKYQIMALCDR